MVQKGSLLDCSSIKLFYVTTKFELYKVAKSSSCMEVNVYFQGERGHIAIYYASPQSYIMIFSFSLAQQLWGLLLNFDWLVHQVECTNVSTFNCKVHYVYHHWGCTLINRTLSYHSRSLVYVLLICNIIYHYLKIYEILLSNAKFIV